MSWMPAAPADEVGPDTTTSAASARRRVAAQTVRRPVCSDPDFSRKDRQGRHGGQSRLIGAAADTGQNRRARELACASALLARVGALGARTASVGFFPRVPTNTMPRLASAGRGNLKGTVRRSEIATGRRLGAPPRGRVDEDPGGRAGVLACGLTYSLRLPIPRTAEQWPVQISTPLTVAGQHRIRARAATAPATSRSPVSLEVPARGPLSLAYLDVSEALLLRQTIGLSSSSGAIYSPNARGSQATSHQPAFFAKRAREQCGLNRSPWNWWPRMDQASLRPLDSAAIPWDAGDVLDAPRHRASSRRRIGRCHVSPNSSRFFRE